MGVELIGGPPLDGQGSFRPVAGVDIGPAAPFNCTVSVSLPIAGRLVLDAAVDWATGLDTIPSAAKAREEECGSWRFGVESTFSPILLSGTLLVSISA